MSTSIPSSLHGLFWDVDPRSIQLEAHTDYVLERLMTRGGWEAMRWIRANVPNDGLVDFLIRKGSRLAPRERAYWNLVTGRERETSTGGGRPPWAGT